MLPAMHSAQCLADNKCSVNMGTQLGCKHCMSHNQSQGSQDPSCLLGRAQTLVGSSWQSESTGSLETALCQTLTL